MQEGDIQLLSQSPFARMHRLRKEFLPQENQILFDNSGKTTREPLAPAV